MTCDWQQRAEQAERELAEARAALDDAQLRSIEARNPGIDMDEVRRTRSADAASPTDAPACRNCEGKGFITTIVDDEDCPRCEGSGKEPPAPTPDDATGRTDTATEPSDLPPADMMMGDRLSALANLPEDWDSYGAKPITTKAIAAARSLHFTPVADGGIQVELHRCGRVAEIRILPDGTLEPEDTATEPLFTGVWSIQPETPECISRRDGDGLWQIEFDTGDSAVARRVLDALNGVRPAAPTVTASDIAVAIETAAIAPGGTWSIPVGGFDGLADALNRLLAEQGGEG